MTTLGKSLGQTVCIARWQFFLLLGTSGFACGMLIARMQGALGL